MSEARLFTLIRRNDETGISGTGRVLDGVIFHTGQVVVCWRSDLRKDRPGYSSLVIYESWDAFEHVHIRPHPPEQSVVVYGNTEFPPFSS